MLLILFSPRGNNYCSHLTSLYLFQKRAIKLVTFSQHLAHSIILFVECNVLPTFLVLQYHTCIILYKLLNKLITLNLPMSVLLRNTSNTSLARNNNIHLHSVRTNYGKHMCSPCAASTWNTASHIDNVFYTNIIIQGLR